MENQVSHSYLMLNSLWCEKFCSHLLKTAYINALFAATTPLWIWYIYRVRV